MRKKSEFMDWFIAQYGKRPFNEISREEFEVKIREGYLAQQRKAVQHEWDACKEAALYVWNARK